MRLIQTKLIIALALTSNFAVLCAEDEVHNSRAHFLGLPIPSRTRDLNVITVNYNTRAKKPIEEIIEASTMYEEQNTLPIENSVLHPEYYDPGNDADDNMVLHDSKMQANLNINAKIKKKTMKLSRRKPALQSTMKPRKPNKTTFNIMGDNTIASNVVNTSMQSGLTQVKQETNRTKRIKSDENTRAFREPPRRKKTSQELSEGDISVTNLQVVPALQQSKQVGTNKKLKKRTNRIKRIKPALQSTMKPRKPNKTTFNIMGDNTIASNVGNTSIQSGLTQVKQETNRTKRIKSNENTRAFREPPRRKKTTQELSEGDISVTNLQVVPALQQSEQVGTNKKLKKRTNRIKKIKPEENTRAFRKSPPRKKTTQEWSEGDIPVANLQVVKSKQARTNNTLKKRTKSNTVRHNRRKHARKLEDPFDVLDVVPGASNDDNALGLRIDGGSYGGSNPSYSSKSGKSNSSSSYSYGSSYPSGPSYGGGIGGGGYGGGVDYYGGGKGGGGDFYGGGNGGGGYGSSYPSGRSYSSGSYSYSSKSSKSSKSSGSYGSGSTYSGSLLPYSGLLPGGDGGDIDIVGPYPGDDLYYPGGGIGGGGIGGGVDYYGGGNGGGVDYYGGGNGGGVDYYGDGNGGGGDYYGGGNGGYYKTDGDNIGDDQYSYSPGDSTDIIGSGIGMNEPSYYAPKTDSSSTAKSPSPANKNKKDDGSYRSANGPKNAGNTSKPKGNDSVPNNGTPKGTPKSTGPAPNNTAPKSNDSGKETDSAKERDVVQQSIPAKKLPVKKKSPSKPTQKKAIDSIASKNDQGTASNKKQKKGTKT